MKPWMWGVLALVLLTLMGIVAGTMVGDVIFGRPGPGEEPASGVEPSAHESAHEGAEVTPTAVPPAEDAAPALADAPDDTDGPAAFGPGAGQDPEPEVDLTPETIGEADFNRVLDAAIEECGLDGWSELDRGCADARCTVLLAMPTPDDGYPGIDHLIQCPAWKNTWGTHADATSSRTTCEDGEQLDVILLNPATKQLQRRGMEGEGFVNDLDEMHRRACAGWGK